MSGLFITFEGPDGAGKTTQLNRVAEWLEQQGFAFVRTREPGGTKISDSIRTLLLNPENSEMANETEVLLYAASRAQLVSEVILPALEDGKIVLCDRYMDASLAYQGYGLGYPVQQIAAINRFATTGVQPDRTYLLDIPVEIGMRRVFQKRGSAPDRIELKDITYHKSVRKGFLTLAEKEPERFCLIDARQGEDAVFSVIQSDLKRHFSLGGN